MDMKSSGEGEAGVEEDGKKGEGQWEGEGQGKKGGQGVQSMEFHRKVLEKRLLEGGYV